MKTTNLLGALLAWSILTAMGEEPKGGPTLVDMQSTRKPKEEKQLPITPAKPVSEILGKQVIYGGYLTELAKAEKKRPFLNLRTPIDPQKDLDNVWFYPGTDKPIGAVLFSIKF